MKEKILKKETIKTETEEILSQETICVNISNLSQALSSLGEIDSAILPEDLPEKFNQIKVNIISSLYILSSHLIIEEPV